MSANFDRPRVPFDFAMLYSVIGTSCTLAGHVANEISALFRPKIGYISKFVPSLDFLVRNNLCLAKRLPES